MLNCSSCVVSYNLYILSFVVDIVSIFLSNELFKVGQTNICHKTKLGQTTVEKVM